VYDTKGMYKKCTAEVGYMLSLLSITEGCTPECTLSLVYKSVIEVGGEYTKF
jgi:hypothetical protein